MNYVEWYVLPDTEKCRIWESMASGQQLDLLNGWSYSLARAMEEQCDAFQTWVAARVKATCDIRCIHALSELSEPVQNIRKGCRIIQQYAASQETHAWWLEWWDAFPSVKYESQQLFRCLVRPLVSQSYHAWRMCRAWLGMSGEMIGNFHWDDLSGWERVCEDEETEVWSHPALPHPADFLYKTKTPLTSLRYADKAQFQCQFPNTLCRYSVVLSRTPSLVPKLSAPTPPTTNYTPTNTDNSAIQQSLFRESTRVQRTTKKRKRRAFSRIWKEKRKSKKRTWRIVATLEEEADDDSTDDWSEEDSFWMKDSCYDDLYSGLSRYYTKKKTKYTKDEDGWTRVGYRYRLSRRKKYRKNGISTERR